MTSIASHSAGLYFSKHLCRNKFQCWSNTGAYQSRQFTCKGMFRDESSIAAWSSQQATPLKMKDLYDVGFDKRCHQKHAEFLHRELPIRLAHAVAYLQSLPPTLAHSAGVSEVIRRFVDSIAHLANSACPRNVAEHMAFTHLLEDIMADHEKDVACITEEVHRFSRSLPENAGARSLVDNALRSFLLMRIATRFQVKHHIESEKQSRVGYSGVLQLDGKPAKIASECAQQSAWLCQERLGQAPRIVVEGDNSAQVACVPGVLSYIFFELFKNASQAVVQRYAGEYDDALHALPPVRCQISHTSTGLQVKINDKGKGISAAQVEKIGQFGYSSNSASPWHSHESGFSRSSPVLSGFGVGLTLCRLYAQYFGGDLRVSSAEGVGTDVTLRIAWSAETFECLPVGRHRQNIPLGKLFN
jgi:pyruvate dehydrogenase kinase 2/3/4